MEREDYKRAGRRIKGLKTRTSPKSRWRPKAHDYPD
jgi:hypothetical protein